MRCLFFCLALLAATLVGDLSFNLHHTASRMLQPAVDALATDALPHMSTGTTPATSATDVTDTANTIQQISDGLYSYHGVDTRRGPQCVELAERFYVTRYPGTFPYHNSGPGAFDIWDGIANGKNVGGWAYYRRYFVAYFNGTTAPQPDDLLLYDRTLGYGWGHIAIIAEVHPDAIVILEQNNLWDTRRVIPLVGDQILDRGVKGVIRLKKLDQ